MSTHPSVFAFSSYCAPVDDDRLTGRTPLDVFSALPKPLNGLWLDTGNDPSGTAWSYIAVNPSFTLEIHKPERLITSDTNPVLRRKFLRSLLRPSPNEVTESPRNGPPWRGGWAGTLSYELGLQHPFSSPSDSVGKVCFYPQILAFSHTDRIWWQCLVVPSATSHDVIAAEAKSYLEPLLTQIASAKNDLRFHLPILKNETVQPSLSKGAFCERVRKVLDFIRDGDIYQLNLSQRLDAHWPASAEDFYLALRAQSPAQFGAFLGAPVAGGHGAIASISPELLLRTRGRHVETRPIKGTRPRPENLQRAAELQDELMRSEKERAELNMIVDLERNDLGRVCEYGSVHVRSAGEIETLPTLFHRVATIEGTLKSGTRPRDLLKAIFPGGSITGAPKRRAMQIIRELEPVPRGPYCGAIGWLDLNGDMELNLAIRTAVCDAKSGTVRYHAGSGIVADSDPETEYEETLQKSAAFLRAVNGTLQN